MFDKVLRKIIEADKSTIKQGFTLGKWTIDHSKIGYWGAYINSSRTSAWVRQENNTWHRCSINRTYLKFQETIPAFTPSKDHIPIKVTMTSTDRLQYTLTTKIHYPPGTISGLYPKTPWEIHMKQQPQWIQGLLEYVTFEHINAVIEELASNPYLLMISDGSGKAKAMTFEWVMCTPGGNRLAQAAGHCQGRKSSLRAEATGMLSATIFIALLQQYRGETITPVKVQYTSDNLELIQRDLKHTRYRDSYPNVTLTAEYDVTEQIFLTNQSNQIEATYSWVRGHQDQYRNTSELSLEAKLNIEADKLAGDFQQQYGTHFPIVPLLPSSPAVLSI